MPFYEYECSHCRYYAEVMQKITDKPLKKCPSCGKTTFKKLISAPVFRLKGSGWYETDFKSDKDNKRNLAGGDKEDTSSKAEAKTETTSESGAAAAGDGKSDSKGEGKSEGKVEAKPEGKSGGKGDAAVTKPAAKTPPPTTRNVAGRQAGGKRAASKRPSQARRKTSKRRGGR
jgi:putative FmdB family regulatory protein